MNTRDVVNAIEDLIDAKLNFGYSEMDAAGNRLVKALRAIEADESDLAPCAAKLKVDFEEDLPKSRYVTFLYDKDFDTAFTASDCARPTRRMIQVLEDKDGVISGMDVDKDEYRRFSKSKIIGNIEEIV